MSKKEKSIESVNGESVNLQEITSPNVPNLPAIQESISLEDQKILEIAQLKRTVALKDAEKALAENKAAELEYKYLIIQLYLKYGMTPSDALDDKGNIHRNYQPQQG